MNPLIHSKKGISTPNLPTLLRHSGVYLQTVEYRFDFLVGAAGLTRKILPAPDPQHPLQSKQESKRDPR